MESFMIGSECADWWEQQIKDYKKELEDYVIENPEYWGVAALKASAADLGYIFFVDLARLGEGFAQGGVKGITQDVLRILSFIPQGKLLKALKPVSGRVMQLASNAAVWRFCKGGVCLPISVAQALQRTGSKFAISLKDIAKALGVPLEKIVEKGVSMSKVAPALNKLGVQFKTLASGSVQTFSALFAKAKTADGPIMVAIKGQRYEIVAGVKTLVDVGHAVLVGKTISGLKIIDRYGMFSNFDELARLYGLEGKWALQTSEPLFVFMNTVIDPQLIKLVERNGIFACLVRESMAIFDFNRSQIDPEFVKQDFQRFVEQRRGSKPTLKLPDIHIKGGKTITVTRGDPARSTLSGMAKAEYQDWMLWPLIYDLNKDLIGPNPNQVKAGLRLLVLPKNSYTMQEIADAKRRAPSWKNY